MSSITHARVAVGTAATPIATEPASVSSALILNTSPTDTVAIGNETVTATTGFQVAAGAAVSIDLNNNDTLYAAATTGTVTVHVLQNRL